MATIDDIRIKLDVDASQVARGVKSAFTQFDAELRKQRVATVSLSFKQQNTGNNAIDKQIEAVKGKIKGLGRIPIEFTLPDDLNADAVRDKIGEIKLPIVLDTSLTDREKARTLSGLRKAIGVVTVDWQLAAEPKGGWPEPPPGWGGGGGGGGVRPSGPGPRSTDGGGASAGRTQEQLSNDQRLAKARKDVKEADKVKDVEARKKAEREVKQATTERDRLAKQRRDAETAERKTKAAQARRDAEAKRGQTEIKGGSAERLMTEAEWQEHLKASANKDAEAGIGGSRKGQRAAARDAAKTPITGAPAGDLPATGPKVARTVIPPAQSRRLVGASNDGQIRARPGRSHSFRTSDAPRGFGRGAFDTFAEALEEAKRTGGGVGSPDVEAMQALEFASRRDSALKEFLDQTTFLGLNPIYSEERAGALEELRSADVTKMTKQLGPAFAALNKKGAGGTPAGLTSDILEEHAPRSLRRRLGGLNARGFDLRSEEGQRAAVEELAAQNRARRHKALRKAYESLETTNPELASMVFGSAEEQAAKFQSAVTETAGGNVNLKAGARLKDPISKVKSGGDIQSGAVEAAQKFMALPLEKRGPKPASDKPEGDDVLREARARYDAAVRSGNESAILNAHHDLVVATAAKAPVPTPPVPANRRAKAMDVDTRQRMSDIRAGMPLEEPTRAAAPEAAPTIYEPITTRPATVDPATLEKERFDRDEAIARAKRVAEERARKLAATQAETKAARPAGAFKMRIPGRAEGGKADVDVARVRHTNQWKQMSLRQRAFQPFCTYCGTAGHKDNPLQADHIRDLALGGAPFDKRNVTTACKSCNLEKRGQLGWAPPGRADGGGIPRLRSLKAIRTLAEQTFENSLAAGREPEDLYYRWSPDLHKDMQPGRTSGTLFDRRVREAGISVNTLDLGLPGLGLNSEYNLSGKSTEGTAHWLDTKRRQRFARRSAFLLRGRPVGAGYDGEDVLDPESIVPLGRISPSVVEQARLLDAEFRKHNQRQVNGGRAAADREVWLALHGRAEGGPIPFADRLKAHMGAWEAENPRPQGEMYGPENMQWWARRQFTQRWFTEQARDAEVPGWRDRREARAGGSTAQKKAMHASAIVQKLIAMATQETQSPNEAAIAKRMLHDKGVPGYADGGYVKHTGLLGRMAQHGDQAAITMVGERGPELIVTAPNGESEVVPTHKVPTWLQRAREGRGFGKDLTHRAEGGGIGGGPFQFPGVTGSLSANNPRLSRGSVASGSITRVFVVNWPTALTGAGGARPIKTTSTGPSGNPINVGAASRARQPGGGGAGGGAGAGAAAGGGGGGAAGGGAGPQAANPGGPLPGVGGVAGAQPGAFVLPSQTAEGKAQLEIARQRQLGVSRSAAQAARAEVAISLAENPVRAFTTSVSQVFQTLAGRGNLTRQAKQAQQAVAEVARAEQNLSDVVKQFQATRLDRRALRAAPQTAERDALLAQNETTFRDQAAAIREWRLEVNRTGEAAEEALAPLGGAGQAFRNLAVGGVSAIGAGLGFTAAFTAFNTALTLGSEVVGEAVERSLGYRNASAQLNQTLAESTRTQRGAAEAAVAQATAQSGLASETSKTIRPLLAARAATIAGNMALEEQNIQLADFRNITENQAPGVAGQFDRNLTRSVGGPFDLGLLPGVLSQKSTFDILSTRLEQGRDKGLFAPSVRNAFGNGLPFGDLVPGINGFMQGGVGLQSKQVRELINAIPILGPMGAGDQLVLEAMRLNTEGLTDLDATLDEMSRQAAKGGFAGTLARSGDAAAVQETLDAFAEILPQDSPFLKQLQDLQKIGQGVALTGGPATAFRAGQFAQGTVQGATTPEPSEIIAGLTARRGGTLGRPGVNALDIVARDIARRGAFQREAVLPAQAALAFASRPITPFGDTRLRPSGTVAGVDDTEGTVAAYEAAFKRYAGFAEPAQARINAHIAKGKETLDAWVGPGLVGRITDLGQDIRDIQLGISQRGLNLEVSQYNNEIRVATRQLNQAKDFTSAIKGNVKDTVGGLQGQNYQMGRQLQLLQQELQQRQINLQLAVAGFQVAGETPEERAARQDAARAEADFAQRQLDLSKNISSNEFTVGLKENANAVVDLSAQIALLREGKALAIDSFAAEEAIKSMEAELQILEQEANQRFEQAVENEQVLLGIWHDIEEAAGKAIDMRDKEFVQLVKAFRNAGTEAGKAAVDFVTASIVAAYGTTIADTFTPQPDSSRREGGTGTPVPLGPYIPISAERRNWEIQTGQNYPGSDPRLGFATGGLFNTSGMTGITVGEAGRETVAILRNPREGSFGGFGGGGSISININLNGNVSMRNEADIAILAQKIEERLSNRLAMTRR